jgi:hypothetical protein
LKNMITILFKKVVVCTYPPVSFDKMYIVIIN